MAGMGSTVVRRQLGRQLRMLRENAGKTIRSVQDAKLFSESKVSRIEAGRIPVRVGDVWALCRFYKADNETTDALAALAEGTTSDGWWEDDESIVPEWLRIYIGLEASCCYLGSYHPELVHGLLQTERYARAVVQSNGPKSEEVIDRQLKLRKERQAEALDRRDRNMQIIMGATALTQEVGPRDLLAEQRSHLCDLNTLEGVDIRVLGAGAGSHPGMSGAFTILDFNDPEDPSVIYVESLTGARYLEGDRHVGAYRRALSTLLQLSQPIEEFTT